MMMSSLSCIIATSMEGLFSVGIKGPGSWLTTAIWHIPQLSRQSRQLSKGVRFAFLRG